MRKSFTYRGCTVKSNRTHKGYWDIYDQMQLIGHEHGTRKDCQQFIDNWAKKTAPCVDTQKAADHAEAQ